MGGGLGVQTENKRYMNFLVRCTKPATKSQMSIERSLKVLDKEGTCIMDPLNKEQRMKTSVNVYESAAILSSLG